MAITGLGAGPVAAVPASAAPIPAGRSEISFDEGWRFFRGDPSGAHALRFNDSDWRPIDLPHDWQIEDLPSAHSDDGAATADPAMFAYEPVLQPLSPDPAAPPVIGPFDKQNGAGRYQGYTVVGQGWYRKHFAVPARMGGNRRLELRFDGVYRGAQFWLNGVYLGDHPYGYVPTLLDLTPHLLLGSRNVVAVRVNSTGFSRWYSGSGIYRHTWLTITDRVHIPTYGIFVTTPMVSPTRSKVKTAVEVRNDGDAAAGVRVRNTLIDPAGHEVATVTSPHRVIPSGHTTTITVTQPVAPARLWAPEHPDLYTARSEVLRGGKVVDSVTTTFGIRSLVWDGTVGCLLNGKAVKLDGANIHHDHGPLGAVALNRAEERTVELIKAAGFNSIRTAHNPRTSYMLDVCDRLGILVWNEAFDKWSEDTALASWYERDMRTFVRRDRNHPSVIIWSIGNEVDTGVTSPPKTTTGPRLAAIVKSLDRTRPVSQGGGAGVGTPTVGGPTWKYMDVGDVHGADPSLLHALYPHKAIMQSEYTAAGTPTSTADGIYGSWAFAHAHSWFVGGMVWAGWDYLGEAGCGATIVLPAGQLEAEAQAVGLVYAAGTVPYPWIGGFQGDLDLIGQRKPQNHYRAVVHGRSPLEMFVARPTPIGTVQYSGAYTWFDELASWRAGRGTCQKEP